MPEVIHVRVDAARKYTLDFHLNCYAPNGVSELGYRVADLLDEWLYGLHHGDPKQLGKVEWDNEYVMSYNVRHRTLCTFDYDTLTRLVLLSLDKMVRVEIAARTFNAISLMFHGRHARTGSMSERMPTPEQFLENWRKSYQVVDANLLQPAKAAGS